MELMRNGSHKMSNPNSSMAVNRFSKVTPALTDVDNLNSDRSLERNLSSKISAMAERRAQRSDWRQQLEDTQEELKRTKNLVNELEKDKDRVVDELQEMKRLADDANLKLSEALQAQETSKKGNQDWQFEVDAIRKQSALDVEALLAVTEELNKLKEELASSKEKMEKKHVNISEDAVGNVRNSAITKSLTFSSSSGKKFPVRDEIDDHIETKVLVEAARNVPKNGTKNPEFGERKSSQNDSQVQQPMMSLKDTTDSKPSVLERVKSEPINFVLARSTSTGKSKTRTPNADVVHMPNNPQILAREIISLRNELRVATEAEDNSRKATDKLASTLKEVTDEANQVKAKLASTIAELESSQTEVEYTNVMLKNSEERFQNLLNEARKEIDNAKQTIERLKLEADESSEAWNDKELVFVECIRKSEEEIAEVKKEKQKLVELLEVSKAENVRLKDILKQALSEATAAKDASEIAKTESSELKDSLSDMADTIEHLKINEAANIEKIKELKAEVEKYGNSNMGTENKDLKKTPSNLKASKRWKTSMELSQNPLEQRRISSEKALPDYDILQGTIFTDDSPKKGKAASTSKSHSHRKASSLVLSASGNIGDNQHDLNEPNSPTAKQKKKRAILHKFGELLRKKSFK